MGCLVLKCPMSQIEPAQVESRFYFADKYLPLAKTGKGEWIVWHLPGRPGVSQFGAYVAIAFVDDVVWDPERNRFYLELSRAEALVPPLRAISPDAVYERGFAERERKATEQHIVRPLRYQEFVNILDDHISGDDEQAQFDSDLANEDRARKMALFSRLLQVTREKIRNSYPHDL